jgi:ubiquinol-cytochrome c reductase cytochrome b subunit
MLTWLDQRTGLVTMTKDFLTEDVPGGASYWYAFGSATLFALMLQIATGIFLCFYYTPSTATAWESTDYLIKHVPLGWLVLSLHYWGASAMIAFMTMHLLQGLLWGAYKKPRELQWIVGVVLFLLTLVLGLTGYLLPWDLNALLASKVAIQISGSAPILGPAILSFLQDGNGIGTLTLNRFFGIHVWLVPALLVGLVGLHLAIFRWNGPAGPPIDEAPKLKPGRFWPEQMFMDTVLSFAMFAVVLALAIFAPAPFDAKADPNNTTFVPYPAWYFLALYALLDYVGKLPPAIVQFATLFSTIIMPGVLVALLIVLPFIDRNPSRRPSRRPWILGITALTLIGAIVFSVLGQMNVVDGQIAHGLVGGTAGNAASTGGGGMPKVETNAGANPNGGGAAGGPGTTTAGQTVFTTNCSSCHGTAGAGTPNVAPALAGNPDVTGDPNKVIGIVLKGLKGQTIQGKTFPTEMPAWKGTLTNKQIADVVTYIRSTWGNKGSAVSEADVAKAAGAK